LKEIQRTFPSRRSAFNLPIVIISEPKKPHFLFNRVEPK
jgi:hypothetical protein